MLWPKKANGLAMVRSCRWMASASSPRSSMHGSANRSCLPGYWTATTSTEGARAAENGWK